MASHGVIGWMRVAGVVWLIVFIVALAGFVGVDVWRRRPGLIRVHLAAWAAAAVVLAVTATPGFIFTDHEDVSGESRRGACIGCGALAIIGIAGAVPVWKFVRRAITE